uniref:Cyclin N-terminal domain-containing protein n=1 Tax=Heterorhabditis bacteriophora TaxID=37862 RepID=A0A1I7X894_HETBA
MLTITSDEFAGSSHKWNQTSSSLSPYLTLLLKYALDYQLFNLDEYRLILSTTILITKAFSNKTAN